jgi:predicted phosphoribosyltransferase
MDPERSTARWGALFRDRVDAGAQLAQALQGYRGQDVLVLGIPRGGVVVAAEVARRLGAELDVIVARKLGAPISRELAIGAVTADGERYLNEDILRELRVSERYVQTVTEEEQAEARRREERFRAGRPPARIAGRTVILVDDGLATGATMRAAVRSVRRQAPARLVVAVPVGARETCEELRAEADEVICLFQPEPFWAVGAHYQRFEPVDDATVQELLRASASTTRERE